MPEDQAFSIMQQVRRCMHASPSEACHRLNTFIFFLSFPVLFLSTLCVPYTLCVTVVVSVCVCLCGTHKPPVQTHCFPSPTMGRGLLGNRVPCRVPPCFHFG
ncbi:unnamed protein product [Discosporangium mesarthrocarpum]